MRPQLAHGDHAVIGVIRLLTMWYQSPTRIARNGTYCRGTSRLPDCVRNCGVLQGLSPNIYPAEPYARLMISLWVLIKTTYACLPILTVLVRHTRDAHEYYSTDIIILAFLLLWWRNNSTLGSAWFGCVNVSFFTHTFPPLRTSSNVGGQNAYFSIPPHLHACNLAGYLS